MFSFTKDQKTVSIGDIMFGGQPGYIPTVLFGGLFFKGIPDLTVAKVQIEQMYDISKQTAIPAIPDLFIRKETYIEPIITFIKENIPDHMPFSVDFTDPLVKIRTLQQLSDHGLLQQTIYNSIHVGITPEEYQALQKWTPEMAILVAFNPKDTSPDGKIEVLENGAHLTEKGLLSIASDIGIEKILIDTAALAPGQNSGAAVAALPVIKEEYGLPVGCAIHNVVEKSTWLQSFPNEKKTIDAASNSNIPLFGGDFALYGPVELSSILFPLIAWQDILISEYTENYFGISPSERHPRRMLQR
ncbi:MAG: hypothetical protein QCH96_04225 [Candidatus Thermoplasmatota archaeon]|nr:hypothetical protein [Candidatus Thermoplasmatota archaeon]